MNAFTLDEFGLPMHYCDPECFYPRMDFTDPAPVTDGKCERCGETK